MSSYSKPLVPSEEKVKILLIEDDERQINYAQQVLVGHELTVMRFYRRGVMTSLKFYQQFDLVITDLVLPHEPCNPNIPSEPYWGRGVEIYFFAMYALSRGYVKGVALVSNYEHHIDSPEREDVVYCREQIERELREAEGNTFHDFGNGKDIDWWHNNQVISNSETPHNFTVVFDRNFTLCSFLDKSGRIVCPNDLPKMSPEFTYEDLKKYVNSEGLYILKPYKEVVDALLMDLK